MIVIVHVAVPSQTTFANVYDHLRIQVISLCYRVGVTITSLYHDVVGQGAYK